MDEKSARRRLKAIERELKYYRKKRNTYLEAQKKAREKEKRRKRMTKTKRILLSALFSAIISLVIMFAFTFLMTVEGDITEARITCFGLPFVLLFIFIYMVLGSTGEIPFNTELKGVNCMIETLEDEKKRIYSKFPSLENENIEVRFGWTWYSLMGNLIALIYIIYLIPYAYAWLTHYKFLYYSSLYWLWMIFWFILIIIQHLEERSLRKCWIRKELGVDPRRLYK